jgi:hypothetical protein
MADKRVYLIWFQSKQDPTNYGIECVCENKIVATNICRIKNNSGGTFQFAIGGEYDYYEYYGVIAEMIAQQDVICDSCDLDNPSCNLCIGA